MHIGKKAWRESASLIILAKNACKAPDYKVLVLKRPRTMHFMPNTIVFPGGAAEAADESRDWIEHFQNCGVSEEKLAELARVEGPRPSIFETLNLQSLKKEISLRITAIRETFEELGVLICRRKDDVFNESFYGGVAEEFNRQQWQSRIGQDPGQFLNLCKEHELVPDIWRLYEWSAWLTPAIMKKRFATAFYLVSVDKEPNLLPCGREVTSVDWETPSSLIKALENKKINLAPPQMYEMSSIERFDTIDDVTKFAKSRNDCGSTLYYPMIFKCADGMLFVYPGDDLYPENPNLYEIDYDLNQYADRTFDQLRQMSKKMNRCEQRDDHEVKIVVNIDYPKSKL